MDMVDVLSLEAEANIALGYIMAAQVEDNFQSTAPLMMT